MTIALKAAYLVLEPTQASEVPNSCLFIDADNGNILSQKSSTGTVGVIASSANANPLIKQMVAGEAFAAGKPLAIRPDGKVVLADSDDVTRKILIGWSQGVSLGNNSVVSVMGIGVSLIGVLNGLGFTSGDTIYMGETPGTYINNPSTGLTGENDVIYKLGIATGPSGLAQASATDLVACPTVITSY